jgi:hypothetical protein
MKLASYIEDRWVEGLDAGRPLVNPVPARRSPGPIARDSICARLSTSPASAAALPSGR